MEVERAAIFALDDLPEKWKAFADMNASYVEGGKFQSGRYVVRQRSAA